jgi:hypothetical protein
MRTESKIVKRMDDTTRIHHKYGLFFGFRANPADEPPTAAIAKGIATHTGQNSSFMIMFFFVYTLYNHFLKLSSYWIMRLVLSLSARVC